MVHGRILVAIKEDVTTEPRKYRVVFSGSVAPPFYSDNSAKERENLHKIFKSSNSH